MILINFVISFLIGIGVVLFSVNQSAANDSLFKIEPHGGVVMNSVDDGDEQLEGRIKLTGGKLFFKTDNGNGYRSFLLADLDLSTTQTVAVNTTFGYLTPQNCWELLVTAGLYSRQLEADLASGNSYDERSTEIRLALQAGKKLNSEHQVGAIGRYSDLDESKESLGELFTQSSNVYIWSGEYAGHDGAQVLRGGVFYQYNPAGFVVRLEAGMENVETTGWFDGTSDSEDGFYSIGSFQTSRLLPGETTGVSVEYSSNEDTKVTVSQTLFNKMTALHGYASTESEHYAGFSVDLYRLYRFFKGQDSASPENRNVQPSSDFYTAADISHIQQSDHRGFSTPVELENRSDMTHTLINQSGLVVNVDQANKVAEVKLPNTIVDVSSSSDAVSFDRGSKRLVIDLNKVAEGNYRINLGIRYENGEKSTHYLPVQAGSVIVNIPGFPNMPEVEVETPAAPDTSDPPPADCSPGIDCPA